MSRLDEMYMRSPVQGVWFCGGEIYSLFSPGCVAAIVPTRPSQSEAPTLMASVVSLRSLKS